MEKYRNVLLNILNILKRISDEEFIQKHWIQKGNYGSIAINCVEALQILDDYSFYDLALDDYGNWKKIVVFLEDQTVISLVDLAQKIETFEEYEKEASELILDPDWREIMKLAETASMLLENDLGVENDSSYLI